MSSRPGDPKHADPWGDALARDAAPPSADEEADAEALVARLRGSLDDRPDVALAGVRARSLGADEGAASAPLEPLPRPAPSGPAVAPDDASAALVAEIRAGRCVALVGPGLAQAEGLWAPIDTMERRLELLRGIPFRAIVAASADGVLDASAPADEVRRRALRPAPHSGWEPRFWEGEGAPVLALEGRFSDAAHAGFLRALLASASVLPLGFSAQDAWLGALRLEAQALLGEPDADAEARALAADADLDARLAALHAATHPPLRLARLLEGRRILWLEPERGPGEIAFARLARAAAQAGRAGPALVRVAAADEALALVTGAAPGERFELAIAAGDEGGAGDEASARGSSAERLLAGLRARDLRCAAVVFAPGASGPELGRRTRAAQALGAAACCASFEALCESIERMLGR